MHFIVLFLLLGACAAFLPRLFRVIELLVLAPVIGCAFGGFAWAIAAMLCSALITWAAFGTFLAGGTALTMAVLARAN